MPPPAAIGTTSVIGRLEVVSPAGACAWAGAIQTIAADTIAIVSRWTARMSFLPLVRLCCNGFSAACSRR
jgi:hypothetical protein